MRDNYVLEVPHNLVMHQYQTRPLKLVPCMS